MSSTEKTPVNKPTAVELEPNDVGRVEFTPDQTGTLFRMLTLAVSKHPMTTYEIRCDGTTRFGPAPVPPTDIDDLDQTFFPALKWDTSMTVIVRNIGTQTRTYVVQAIGWEEDE